MEAAQQLLLIFPVLLFSIVAHEYAHGWVAKREGDPTASMLGRLTLNPIPHIDPIGSIAVPLLLVLLPGGIIFGWAKPVPVNPRNFRNYKRGDILVSLAGVSANLVLAVGFTLLMAGFAYLAGAVPGLASPLEVLRQMARWGILLNLILVFFNLIPIPPLDGSHVLYHLLPPALGARYRELGRYGLAILMVLIFFVPQLFRLFLWPALALDRLALSVVELLL